MTAATWKSTRRNVRADLIIAVLLAAAAALSLYVGSDPAISGPAADYPVPLAIGSIAALHLLVAVRRRIPVVALLLGMIAYLPLALAEVPELHISPVSLLVLLYTAGAYGGRHRDAARTAAALTVAGLLVHAVVRTPPVPFDVRVPIEVLTLFTAAVNAVSFAGAWMLGNVVQSRRQREQVLEEQAVALASAQVGLAHRAVVDERLRIARELHDVLAHHVSLMGVQAGAARRILSSRPDAVPELLASVEGSSREALVELQRMLGLLRDDDADGADRGAQARLAGLDELADQMRQAGLVVELDLETHDDDLALPTAVDLSAYRIVQEALTNTLKHAGPGTTAQVAVIRTASALQVSVVDNGSSKAAYAAGSGHGIVGMRERVNILGGELRVGRRPAGGYEVRAWLPLAAAGAERTA